MCGATLDGDTRGVGEIEIYGFEIDDVRVELERCGNLPENRETGDRIGVRLAKAKIERAPKRLQNWAQLAYTEVARHEIRSRWTDPEFLSRNELESSRDLGSPLESVLHEPELAPSRPDILDQERPVVGLVRRWLELQKGRVGKALDAREVREALLVSRDAFDLVAETKADIVGIDRAKMKTLRRQREEIQFRRRPWHDELELDV